jgi:hypothetical protein
VPGITMNMGLGSAGTYSGPVFGGDGPSGVPATGGYADTGAGRALMFGPGQVSGGGPNPTAHAFAFGVACFAALIFLAWALPR